MNNDISLFIQEIFKAVQPLLPDNMHPYTAFADGPERAEEYSSQEAAVLRGVQAKIYTKVIKKNAHTFKIDYNKYKIRDAVAISSQDALSGKKTIAYNHSCCPKYIRRWMKNTRPRKRARVEFCTLIYCWANNWSEKKSSLDDAHLACQEQLINICKKYGYSDDELIKDLKYYGFPDDEDSLIKVLKKYGHSNKGDLLINVLWKIFNSFPYR